MAKTPDPKRDLDQRTKIDLPPEEAMRALLKVKPDDAPELSEDEVAEIAEPKDRADTSD